MNASVKNVGRQSLALLSHNKTIRWHKGKICKGVRCMRGHSNQSLGWSRFTKKIPREKTLNSCQFFIIKRGSFKVFICKEKSTGLNDVQGNSHTGTKTNERAHVLRDFRLVKDKVHGFFM